MSTITEKQTSTMKWYIVRAQSNREKSVSERLIKEGGDDNNIMGEFFKEDKVELMNYQK